MARRPPITNPFNPIRVPGRDGLTTAEEMSRVEDLIKNSLAEIIRQIDITYAPLSPPTPPGTPAAPADALYWLSQAAAALPNGVDLGARGTGVLQQTVTGGVADPDAVAVPEHAVLFGGADGLLDYDAAMAVYIKATGNLGIGLATPAATARAHLYESRAADGNRYWTQPTKLIVENPDATGLSGVMFAGNQGLPSMDTETWFEKTAGIFYSSDSYPGPSGGGTMIFSVPQNIGAIQGFSWVASGQRRMTHQLVDSAHNQWRLTEIDGGGDGALGRTGWQMDTGNATPIGEWAVTGSGLTADPAPFDVRNAMVSYYPGGGSMYWATDVLGAPDRSMMLGGGSLFLPTSLGAGGMVYATGAGAGQLALATIGTGLSFSGGTLSATGGTGTVTSVTASSPLSYTGTTSVNITHDNSALGSGAHGSTGIASFTTDAQGHVTAFTGANYQTAGNYITALTGDGTATGPGSAALTLATVNASPGTYAYATVTVNGKGLATAVTAGATPALASRTLSATAPLLIDGGHGPLDLSANRTFSHDTSGVGAGTSDWATVQVDAYGHVTGIAAGTWPTNKYIVVSTGSGPTGEAAFTYDTATNLFRLDGFQGIGVDPGSLGDGKYVLAVYGNATQDRIYMRPGGITLAASGAFKQWELSPATTALSTNPANTLLADAFFAGMTYTGGAGSATVALATTVYIAGPPTMPYEMEGGLYTLYVAAGISHFVTVEATDLSTSATLGTAGTFAVGGGANLINALGGATQLGFFSATPVGQQTGGSATAGVVYTATEQAMLQKAYDCLRSFGLLS